MKKKIMAGIMAIGLFVMGIAVCPAKTEAVETILPDKVIYKQYADANSYWTKKIAPVEEGYVFGGWFEKTSSETTTSETYTDADGTMYYEPLTSTVSDNAYAKFVPAQVLSVKAQNEANVNADTASTYVRIISSLDSKNYQKVGFDIWLANSVKLYRDMETKTGELETTKIYDGLLVGEQEVTANSIFGGVSKYVSVWQLENIAKEHYEKIIYVRPYWITKDGTTVEGLAKYVHIEDQYLDYVSIPVNVLPEQNVAAGKLYMTYTEAIAQTDAIKFEAGRILPEMEFYHDTAGKAIRMVGNAMEYEKYHENESLYANIRIKKTALMQETTFTMEPKVFCDWEEAYVAGVKAWDIAYEP